MKGKLRGIVRLADALQVFCQVLVHVSIKWGRRLYLIVHRRVECKGPVHGFYNLGRLAFRSIQAILTFALTAGSTGNDDKHARASFGSTHLAPVHGSAATAVPQTAASNASRSSMGVENQTAVLGRPLSSGNDESHPTRHVRRLAHAHYAQETNSRTVLRCIRAVSWSASTSGH